MSRNRHERITEIFEELLALPPDARQARLARNDVDADMRTELEELLEYADRDDAFADEKIGNIAQEFASGDTASDPRRTERPEILGRYRILGEIGRGGMGVVYEAEQSAPQRRVALKVLRAGLATSEAVRRFERETEILGRLRHPGIAHIYEAVLDAEGDDDRPFFAMELVDGLPLDRHAHEHDLDLEARVLLVADACDAIHYAHANGVLHRDLKPSNILVDTTDGAVKILDFGIARAIDAQDQGATLETRTGHIIGTIAYMSPEQIEPTTLVDTRCDVYALGVILYELLTGELPFNITGQGIVSAARLICERDPRSPDSLDPKLRGDLTTIIRKAMSRDREDRYASAAALGEDLRRYLRDEPITARPASGLYQIRMLVKRHRAVASVTLVALLLIVASSIWALVERAAAIENREVAVERADAVTRLSDLRRLRKLRGDFDTYWPPHPEQLNGIDEWIDEARDLHARIPLHEERLAALRTLGQALPAPAGDENGDENGEADYDFGDDVETAWWHEALVGLLAELHVLGSDDPTRETLPQMIRRRDFAASIEERSVTGEAAAAAWAEAVAYASNETPYGGLKLEPILGLFPLGPDPESGLLEFWHLQSGERPQRDPESGRFDIRAATGLVLVLLPGKTFLLGSSSDPGGPNYVAEALDNEQPVIEVPLDAFLMSKYELTRGQWERLMGSQPDDLKNAESASDTTSVETGRYPIAYVSWRDCLIMSRRSGLAIPTEAQWEYACRAGTDTPWATGSDPRSLIDAANLADASFSRQTAQQIPAETWDDGYRLAAPVGSLTPNAFGLHDVHGNVWEWCRDRMTASYADLPPREGDGFREGSVTPKPIEIRVARGGSFYFGASFARSSIRSRYAEGHGDVNLGFRPSAPLPPAD